MANKKVQDLYANNPKYSTSNQYGGYLNQNSDSYLNYLSGKSNDAYTVDSKTAGMLGNYDKTFQYSQAIRDADKAGDYKKAAVLEYLMNQKIKNENLPYIQQDNYSSYLNGITQSDVNMARYGVDVTPTGLYYKVQDNGKAPPGLKVGDQVVTAGGVWMITALNPDGTYADTVKVDGGTNTTNFTGAYTTPNSTLAAQGMYTPENTMDASAFQAPTVDPSTYQIQGSEVPTTDLTSSAPMPTLRDVYDPGPASMGDYEQQLQDLTSNQLQRAYNQIDYATNQGVTEYQRALEDALPTYAAQRGQADLEGSRNAKNAALYAEQRGDRGGIGAAQYNALQIARANQINQINTAQNKAASDTARAIADLRNKGEFEKADKLMEVTNNYLSQLMEQRKWVQQFNLQYAEHQSNLRDAEFNYMKQWSDLTGRTPDGSNTFAANSANAQLQAQLLPYFGQMNGQSTIQLQEAQQEARRAEEEMAINKWKAAWDVQNAYADRYGKNPLTGQDTTAEQDRKFTNRLKTWDISGYDPINNTPSAQMYQFIKQHDHDVKQDSFDNLMKYASAGMYPDDQMLKDAGITSDIGKLAFQVMAGMAAQGIRGDNAEAAGLGYPATAFGAPGTSASSITTGGGVGTTSGSGGSSGGSSGGGSSRSSGSSSGGSTPVASTPTNNSKDASTTVQAVKNAIKNGQYTIAQNLLNNGVATGKISESGSNYKSLSKSITEARGALKARTSK